MVEHKMISQRSEAGILVTRRSGKSESWTSLVKLLQVCSVFSLSAVRATAAILIAGIEWSQVDLLQGEQPLID
jgi:hypothetical protein